MINQFCELPEPENSGGARADEGLAKKNTKNEFRRTEGRLRKFCVLDHFLMKTCQFFVSYEEIHYIKGSSGPNFKNLDESTGRKPLWNFFNLAFLWRRAATFQPPCRRPWRSLKILHRISSNFTILNIFFVKKGFIFQMAQHHSQRSYDPGSAEIRGKSCRIHSGRSRSSERRRELIRCAWSKFKIYIFLYAPKTARFTIANSWWVRVLFQKKCIC